jgi:hypothetical protein
METRLSSTESRARNRWATAGHASVLLSNGKDGKLPLANQSLTVRELFPTETVEFPFADLDENVRSELRKCF